MSDYSKVSFRNNGKLKPLIIVGTRPEIIRLAAVIKKTRKYFDVILAHTGQNYDYTLNGVFFHDLELADPEVYLNAVGSDLGETMGNIIAESYKLAEKYDKLVDVHCDEIDDEASRGLETLACRAYESGMGERVTASHTTAMHSYNNAYAYKLFRLLKMSNINFVSNPLVNTHLQGRLDTYPKRRGVTRVKELLEAGINVSMGHDDLFDPWYPLGDGNLLNVVHMGLHVCQMMGYEEILNSYKLITHNAARTLNLSNYGIKEGNPADFIVLDATNFYDVINERSAMRYSYRGGKLIASTTPAVKSVLF